MQPPGRTAGSPLRAERHLRFGKRPCFRDLLQRRPKPGGRSRQLDRLGDQNGPGHQRCKGEPDHHRLHDDVRFPEHRPGRQFLLGRRGGGGRRIGLRGRSSDGRGRRGRSRGARHCRSRRLAGRRRCRGRCRSRAGRGRLSRRLGRCRCRVLYLGGNRGCEPDGRQHGGCGKACLEGHDLHTSAQ